MKAKPPQPRARRLVVPALATLTIAAAMVVHVGCSSSPSNVRRTSPPATEAGDSDQFTGGHQGPPALPESLARNEADFKDAPGFDLNAVLRSAQGGANSPFKDERNGMVPWSRAESPDSYRLRAARPGDSGDLAGFSDAWPDAKPGEPTAPGEPSAEELERARVNRAHRAAVTARIGEFSERLRQAQSSPFRTRATTEVWVIERARILEPSPIDDTPGCGSLVTTLPEHQSIVPVPLNHTEVNAAIGGFISSVTVTQQFHNPYSSKIEAVYVFPLPENAAVSEFLMTVGDRTIRGIVRERGEAERVYQQARAQGYVASLMTQERPNIFTQRVANIEPGKSIDVNVTYYSTLAYADGAYEFVFPMVVGPRFNPPSSNGQGIGAVPANAPGSSGQATEVAYLRPTQRSGHDIAINVDIDAWVDIERIECNSHAIEVNRDSDRSKARVTLSRADSIPNKDFVLRTVVAGDNVKSRVITHRDDRGGFFSLMLVPPRDLAHTRRGPVEMVYVLDCSGSMQGRPMEQAKAAVERGLSRLEPSDTFQLIDFSVSASRLGARPLPATPDNLRLAREYLASLNAGGGTMMMTGLKASLGFPHDPERLRYVAFLTDGYIGNEQEILTCQAREQRDSRVFSFGVGTSVNRHLMDSMARVGRGVTAYVAAGDSPTEVMDLFHDRVAAAALSDIKVEWNADVKEVFPSRTPDLFVGRPVILTGRFDGPFSSEIVVTGRAGGQLHTLRLKPEAGGIFGGRTPALPSSGLRTSSSNSPTTSTPPSYGIREVNAPAADSPSTTHRAAEASRAKPGEWSTDRAAPADDWSHARAAVTPAARGTHPLPQIWARMKISDLSDRAVFDPGAWIEPEIRETALRFSLLSSSTAFVAVDSMTRTGGAHGTTVQVPVPVPQGVRYDTTVPER